MNKKNNLLLPIVMLLSGITYTAHSAQPAAAAKATADMTAPQTQASAQSNSASVTIMFGGQPVTAPQWVFEQFAAIENYLEDTQNWLFGGHILTEPQRAAIEQEDRLELTKMCLHDDGTHALDIHNIALSRFLDEVCKKDAHGASHAFAPAHVFQLLLNFVEYTQAPYMFSEKRYDFSTEHIKTLIAQLNQLNVNDLAAFVRIAKNLCLKEKPFAALEDYLHPLIDRPEFSEAFLIDNENALQLAFDCTMVGFKKILPHTLMLASGDDSLTLDASPGKLFGNHQGTAVCSAFSPDGTLIATGSFDGTAKVSNTHTGEILCTINHYSDMVNSIAFSPDGTLIAIGSNKKIAIVSNALTGQLMYTIRHDGPVCSIVFSPDGSLIATGSGDSIVNISNALTGEFLYAIEHARQTYSVAFSPDGSLIATGSWDKTAKVSNARTGELLCTINHADWVNSVVFSPDGTLIATGSRNDIAKVSNPRTGEILCTINHAHVTSVAFSRDGTLIATGSYNGTATISNARTGKILCTIHHTDWVHSVVFSPDGTLIVTCSNDKTAKVSNARTGQLLYIINHAREGSSACFSPDGKSLLIDDRLIPTQPLIPVSGIQNLLAQTLKSKDPKLNLCDLSKELQQLLQTLPVDIQKALITQPRITKQKVKKNKAACSSAQLAVGLCAGSKASRDFSAATADTSTLPGQKIQPQLQGYAQAITKSFDEQESYSATRCPSGTHDIYSACGCTHDDID